MKKPTLFILYYDLAISGVSQKIVDIVNYPETKRRFGMVVVILRRRKPNMIDTEIRNKNVITYFYSDTRLSTLPLCFPIFALYISLRYKPNSILAFCYVPSLVAAFIKTIIFFNGIRLTISITEDYRGLARELQYNVPFLRKIFLSLIRKQADVVIAINNSISDALGDTYQFSKKTIRLVKNWYKPLDSKKNSPITKVYDLIYIGRIERDKNILHLLKAVKTMNQNHFSVSLCIVGSGSEEERLHQYVLQNKLEARVMFVGFTRDTDYYLRRSLLFVSSSENEGAPLSFLDAMHHELPIICLQFPSVQEIVIQGKTGYVFQNRNMFIQHVLFLLSHPQIRMRMGRQAANWVNSHYSPKNILEYLNC